MNPRHSADALPGAATAIFAGSPDLARSDLGGIALIASDEFFAGRENLLTPGEPIWIEGRYTDRGKWMDGWEPRRRRAPGHDWCIVRLGVPGDLIGVDIDTRFFLGNHAPFAALDATHAPADATAEWLRDHAEWISVLPQTPLERDAHNVFALSAFAEATHVRLNIYPAGGVARLRVHARPRAPAALAGEQIDLACITNGGRALACSDMFFSRMENLILPTEAPTMGHGWETKRSFIPRRDWVILQLGAPGLLDSLVLDTRHFKGNYPEGAEISAIYWPGATPHALALSDRWQRIAGPARLAADMAHTLAVADAGPWTHLMLTILSDGGVSRLRAFGRLAGQERVAKDALLAWLNGATPDAARAAMARCCGAPRFVRAMIDARPFVSRAHLHGAAEHIWWHLGDRDWRAAFECHPRLGDAPDAANSNPQLAASKKWSASEQAGVLAADAESRQALAHANREYEARFGYTFILCATGLGAAETLACLRERMMNPPEVELRIAAREQMRITSLRLEKIEVSP